MMRRLTKKHLSSIVLERMFLVITGSFVALMTVTVVFIYFFAKSRTNGLISFSLDDLIDYTLFSLEGHMTDNTERFTEDFETFASDGPPLFTDQEFDDSIRRYFKRCVDYNPLSLDEINLVDADGIIRISTVPEYEGFDMHSGEQSAQFLCLLEGTDVFLQDMQEISYDNKTVMWYAGAALKNTKGFLQVGLGVENYHRECEYYLSSRIRDERVGRTGYYLLLDPKGKVIGSPKDSHNGDILELSADPKELAVSGKVIKHKVYGNDCYVGARPFNDDVIVVVYPAAEAWETWNISMIVLIAVYALVLSVLFILLNRLITGQVVNGVSSLNDSLLRITDGDLDVKADFRDSIEFDGLSDGINFTVDRLKQLIKEAEERIDTELALAAGIQRSFIPHKFPPFPDRNEFDLFASMKPAKEVGGDFYDFFFTDDDHLALVIADVSGKGIPAAMFMVMSKDKIKHSVMKYQTDVANAVREVNTELIKENEAGLFVTVWLGVIDLITGHVDYVDAGHEYPLICRAGGKYTIKEDVHCGPVAALEEMEFDAGSFDLMPGDMMYLFTDGVTEANDADGEMFRISRMLDALNADPGASVEEADRNVREAIDDFVKDTPQFDDMTTIVFRYKGKGHSVDEQS